MILPLRPTTLTPEIRVQLTLRLCDLQRQCDYLMHVLGVDPRGRGLARFDQADGSLLLVFADGCGGATVELITGTYPVGHSVLRARVFATQHEALRFALELHRGGATWGAGDAIVGQEVMR
jgi:hypothetical protein